MVMPRSSLLLCTAIALALAGCKQAPVTEPNEVPAEPTATAAAVDHSDPIASAMAAAPASISKDATIVTIGEDGAMATLREGSNGYTCMPDSPATPGPDPMCMDKNSMAWAMAWIGHKEPPAETPGIMYMLAGGTDASNVDPYATAPSEGSDWIKTGPHLMVVGSAKALEGYPTGDKPDTSAPYVMWAGTPYAHLMVPIG